MEGWVNSTDWGGRYPNCAGGLCLSSAKNNVDKEKRFAVVSDVTLGLGIAAVGVGLYKSRSCPSKRWINVTDPHSGCGARRPQALRGDL